MSTVRYGTLIPIDGDDIDTRGMDFSRALPTGDSLASCTVTVASGTGTVSATQGGTYGTSASASVSDNVATVWIKGCVAPEVTLRFRGVTTQGRQLDLTGALRVGAR